MKVKLVSIHGRGKENEERALLRVDEDCNLMYFLLCDTTYLPEGMVSNRLRHTFWFPSQKVKKGELIQLRTGKGTNHSAKISGVVVHFLFWQLDRPIWNDEKDAGLLFELDSWMMKEEDK